MIDFDVAVDEAVEDAVAVDEAVEDAVDEDVDVEDAVDEDVDVEVDDDEDEDVEDAVDDDEDVNVEVDVDVEVADNVALVPAIVAFELVELLFDRTDELDPLEDGLDEEVGEGVRAIRRGSVDDVVGDDDTVTEEEALADEVIVELAEAEVEFNVKASAEG